HTAPPDLCPSSLHDALPIFPFRVSPSATATVGWALPTDWVRRVGGQCPPYARGMAPGSPEHGAPATNKPVFSASFFCRRSLHARSEEHTSELQSRVDLVCRL